MAEEKQYLVNESTLKDIANAVREKDGSVDLIKLVEMAAKIRAIPKGKPELEKTVEITANGQTVVTPDPGSVLTKVTANVSVPGGVGLNALDYASSVGFRYATFPAGTSISFDIKHASGVYSLTNLFYYAKGVEKVSVSSSLDITVDIGGMFEGCNSIKQLTLSGNARRISSMPRFTYYSLGLEEIIGELDLTTCTDARFAFFTVKNLKEIRFKANSINVPLQFTQSGKLSAESVQSIVNGLKDLSGEAPKTIAFAASTVFSAEQKAVISAKNWTLVQ